MTVSSTTSKVSFSGNGSTTAFAVSFYFLANTDLKVTLRKADGTEVVKTLATDYTVTGAGVSSGGTVTMNTAPASGETLVITRNVALTQPVDYQPNDPFPANTHEQALDRLTMITQQLNETVARSIKVSTTNTIGSPEFTVDAATRANKVLSFDASGELAVTQELGTYKGSWASGTTYAVRSIIKDTSNSNIYICLTAHTASGAQPISTNTDSAKWALIVDAAAAATSASAAATSATAAATSATNAASSASAASTSATAATTNGAAQVTLAAAQVSLATTQATNAATSATNAASSATSASGSASAASTSATNASSSATAAANSATAAAAAAAAGLYRQVLDKNANYTVLAADQGTLFRIDTSGGARTITLPQISTVSDGFKVSVVKWTGDANGVTVNRSGTDTINGATSSTIGSQYSQTTFVADFETNQWFASSSGLGSTNVSVDVFSGNGSTTAFTLSGDPGTKNNTFVHISGVYQNKSTYSQSGTTITFSTAPPSGTNNVEIVWTQPLTVGVPSDGTVTAAKMASGAAAGNLGFTPLNPANNLSDVANAATARTNLGAQAALGFTPVNKAGDTMTGALNEAANVTLASASTVAIGAAAANTVNISGTTTITAFDSIAAGAVRRLIFAGALTLTYNATSMILPGAADITTAAGDVAEFVSLGSGNWRCFIYTKANGAAIAGGGAAPVMNVYTSPGTWTKPASVKAIKVTVVGGGGGGGGNNAAYAAAGGGGGTVITNYPAPSLPGPQPYTVGTGGAGGPGSAPSYNGSAGNTSSFGAAPITVISATGGGGGVGNSGATGTPGSGGVGANGQINIYGSAGTGPIASGTGNGGGTFLSGLNAGGARGSGGTASGYGQGGFGSTSPTLAGQTGGTGVIIVEEFY